MSRQPKQPIVPVKTAWRDVVLVCGKCSKKLKGGFGPDGDERLGKALKRDLGGGKGRRARLCVIETKCLDICPKKAVMAASGRHPERLLAIREGTPIDTIAQSLGLAAPGAEDRTG